MSKHITPLALTLAVAFAAAAHADAAKPQVDLYDEAVWDIHAAAPSPSGNAGTTAAGDIHEEAVWDVQAEFDDPALAKRFAKTQRAEKSPRPAGRNARGLFQAE